MILITHDMKEWMSAYQEGRLHELHPELLAFIYYTFQNDIPSL
jgi:hypothetical protein